MIRAPVINTPSLAVWLGMAEGSAIARTLSSMSANDRLARHFESIANLMQLLGEDGFRVNAHTRAARVLGDLSTDASSLDRKALLAIEGIGPKIADKIIEFAATSSTAEFKDLNAKVPPGLLPLLEVPGLGPKTLRTLWTEGGIVDEATLRASIADGSILKLPRMGAKSVEKLRQSLDFARTVHARIRIGQALPIAERIVERMKAQTGVVRAAFAGSARRGRDTVGDLDILVSTSDADFKDAALVAAISGLFRAMPEVRHVLASGDTRSSIQYALNSDDQRWGASDSENQDANKGPVIQVDLRIVPESSFGAALAYFTGSKDHNVHMRERALSMGLTLNEYGLYPDDKHEEPPHKRGLTPVAGTTEESIFAALKLPYIPPEIREDHSEFKLAATPALITIADIKAELHAHTTASDGRMSIVELAQKAKSRGFHTITVTDHSRSSAQAGGLSIERLIEHIAAIHAARGSVPGITILAGSEVDILADGSLDYPDEILAKLDVVVASPHTALSQDPATATARLLKAISHPLVHILGHPTGRLINRRPGLEPDMAALIAAAKQHNTALEINAHWMRLDLHDVHARAAIEAGALLAINCDVHEAEDYDNLQYGVLTARRAGTTPSSVINTWPAAKLHAWLKAKRS
jgi:DNA polymerase (family 10)